MRCGLVALLAIAGVGHTGSYRDIAVVVIDCTLSTLGTIIVLFGTF